VSRDKSKREVGVSFKPTTIAIGSAEMNEFGACGVNLSTYMLAQELGMLGDMTTHLSVCTLAQEQIATTYK
jgi:hypothetical protein